MPAAKKENTMSFEKSLERLEEIANILENQSPTLSDALSLYEEGAKLLKECASLLDTASAKITVLSKE
jgi:exodeoxyribonuclease VII small subunit